MGTDRDRWVRASCLWTSRCFLYTSAHLGVIIQQLGIWVLWKSSVLAV